MNMISVGIELRVQLFSLVASRRRNTIRVVSPGPLQEEFEAEWVG
ncbi:hypothetical protein PLANPX_2988 [Lacipirellula parvula]|uniref:Uncharacterized protein n=1 Tax=Lacipirellula parvula TaxID=2650471 RepID=A0A5K7XGG5_9BACT|nr:hypothetical protein PLANPX_2988 [Lacipirellula parvula]